MRASSIVAVILLAAAAPQGQLPARGRRPSTLQEAPAKATALRDPYAAQPEAVEAGRKLFEQHCAACHGTNARGVGKAPGLRSPDVQTASPGGLFWYLTNGNRRKGMPSWSSLPAQRRWQIVTYLKSLNHDANVRSPIANPK